MLFKREFGMRLSNLGFCVWINFVVPFSLFMGPTTERKTQIILEETVHFSSPMLFLSSYVISLSFSTTVALSSFHGQIFMAEAYKLCNFPPCRSLPLPLYAKHNN
ncbi:hypothetical protein ACJW30_03G147000 [Castanea mollissima]